MGLFDQLGGPIGMASAVAKPPAVPNTIMPRNTTGTTIDRAIDRRSIYQGMQGDRSGFRSPMPSMRSGNRPGRQAINDPVQSGQIDPAIADSPAAQDLLKGYGLAPAQHVNPFLMFSDQQGLGKSHPRLAHMLEGGLLGMQASQGNSAGENISNVAGTLTGIPGMYARSAQEQRMAPFRAASVMQALQNGADEHQLRSAQINEANARADALRSKPEREYGTPVVGRQAGSTRYTYQTPDIATGKLSDTGVEAPPNKTEHSQSFQEQVLRGVIAGDPDAVKIHNIMNQDAGAKAAAAEHGRVRAQATDENDLSPVDKQAWSEQSKTYDDKMKTIREEKLDKPSDEYIMQGLQQGKELGDIGDSWNKQVLGEADKVQQSRQGAFQDFLKSRNKKNTAPAAPKKRGVMFHPDGRIEIR